MSAAYNDGGPAFPAAFDNHTGGNIMVGGKVVPHGSRVECLGMTLRDYFAAKALQGLVASPNTSEAADDELLAKVAYSMADAMLKAREVQS